MICKGRDHLYEQLDLVLKSQGEGLILKSPSSRYEGKRSKFLLKVKVMHDAEAKVIEIIKGTGRCESMMGAVLCRMKNNVTFKLGSGFTDE